MATETKALVVIPDDTTPNTSLYSYRTYLRTNILALTRPLCYDPIAYGADKTGVADSRTAFASILAVISSAGTNETIEVTTGTYKISSNLTIPSTVTLKFHPGAMLSIDTGVVVTIVGGMNEGLSQRFSGLGTVSFAGNTSLKEAYPHWWGGAGDYAGSGTGGTDNHLPFEACATACATNGVTMFVPHGNYKTTATISIPTGVPITQEGAIYYYGDTEEPCMVIGTNDLTNYANLTGLSVRRVTQSDWTNESNVGIRIMNHLSAKISVSALYFTIGVQFTANNSHTTSQNIVEGRAVFNNLIGLDLNGGLFADGSADEYGWVNENTFIGGRFLCETSLRPGVPRYGVRIKQSSTVPSSNLNNNTFINPSFELKDSTAIPMLFEDAYENHVLNARDESNGTVFATVANTSEANHVHLGYGTGIMVDTSDYQTSYITHARYGKQTNDMAVVFDSGFIPRKLSHYDNGGASSSSRYFFKNLHYAYYSSGDSYRILYSSIICGIEPYNNVVKNRNISANISGLGFFVDTTYVKEFVFKSHSACRLAIRVFDVNGTIITPSAVTPLVKGISTYGFSAGTASTYFDAYYQSATSGDRLFTVDTSVKKIEVIAFDGTYTADYSFSRFALYTAKSVTTIPKTWILPLGTSARYDGENDQFKSLIQPAKGFHDTGDVIFDGTGVKQGWRCTQRIDTTLKTPALVATDTSVNININTSNLLAGDVVGILLDDGTIHWTTVQSITDADTIVIANAIPALMGAAIGNAIYTMRWTGDTTIAGALNHDGSTVGLFGTAPAVQPTGIAVQKTNYTAGDLDTEAEIISAMNTHSTALNAIRTALNALGATTTV